MSQILKQLAVAGGLITLALIGIWDWASDGGIISVLGGVTVTQFQDGMDDIRQGNGACSWEEVGYDKSHYQDENEWCPAGSFIRKIDLDGCGSETGRSERDCPIIGRVQCCEIVPTAQP